MINHKEFISAIHKKRKILLTFYSKEDKCNLKRKCAPLDFGPSRKAKIKIPKYWFWDYESDKRPHPLGLKKNQIKEFEVLTETFDPSKFINWRPNWFIKRDWGKFS